ncbi:MAG: TnsA endonuclease N-terminal domain-containing protein [Nevskia sp.]|nr:TnsA endonuclease N-terminal domain-containing protein [Nevskia sp.]
MRTTKRFTLGVLERFEREGRGTGILDQYIPFHRVGRGDPASRGRSHLIVWGDRQRELLSDLEWVVLLFVTMLGGSVIDVREQFPLALNDRPHELGDYDVRAGTSGHPGTLAIAEALQVKHPRVRGVEGFSPWTMTTDFLVTLRNSGGMPFLLALSCKYDNDATSPRARELLGLERQYWLARQVDWLLITPALFDASVALSLRRASPWVFDGAVPDTHLDEAVRIVRAFPGRSLTAVLEHLAHSLGDTGSAQRAYWQAVWIGRLPIDLRSGWRPHLPPVLLTPGAFKQLNPVACGRSSWS